MTVHSPNAGAPVWICDLWMASGGDQRQAPVAAENRRRVMRLRVSRVTCSPFDLMRQLSKKHLSI